MSARYQIRNCPVVGFRESSGFCRNRKVVKESCGAECLGVARHHETKCDVIVGIGGGSLLDAAKAMITLKVTHFLPLADYDDLKEGSTRISSNVPPSLAVPTTSGTGSGVSRSSVITAWTFTHNFEAYLPKGYHPLSDAIALGEVM
jgi:alcohol dehydrogenase class IV